MNGYLPYLSVYLEVSNEWISQGETKWMILMKFPKENIWWKWLVLYLSIFTQTENVFLI